MQAMSDDESQLVLVEAQLNALLADRPIDSYNFNAGDGGSQQATYRKISDLQTLKMQLRDNIERYARLIWGGALVNHNLRRKG